jgi:hypothetical protein
MIIAARRYRKVRTLVASRRCVKERKAHHHRLDATWRSGWMLCSGVMKKRIAAERYISSALALYWGVIVERTTSGRYEESRSTMVFLCGWSHVNSKEHPSILTLSTDFRY